MTQRKKSNPTGPLAALLLLLFIIIVLIVALRSCGSDDAKKPNESLEPSLSESQQPQQGDETDAPEDPDTSPSELPSPSVSPSEEPSPSLEPTPTPTPSPTPTPTPIPSAAGNFRSNTGMGLNVSADWTAVDAGNGKVKLKLQFFVESYALNVGKGYKNVIVTINDEKFTYDAPAITYDGKTLEKNELCTVELVLSVGADGKLNVPMTAEWIFMGKYGDAEIENISAAGLAQIG